jgi:hypothetical protein
MTMKIYYDYWDSLPKEVRGPIERELSRCKKYLPHWLTQLWVNYTTAPEDQRGQAQVVSQPEYFSATLKIMPKWFNDSPQERHHAILHEIGHLHHAQAYQTARTIIEEVTDGKQQELCIALLKRTFEESAEGFATMIEALEHANSTRPPKT